MNYIWVKIKLIVKNTCKLNTLPRHDAADSETMKIKR